MRYLILVLIAIAILGCNRIQDPLSTLDEQLPDGHLECFYDGFDRLCIRTYVQKTIVEVPVEVIVERIVEVPVEVIVEKIVERIEKEYIEVDNTLDTDTLVSLVIDALPEGSTQESVTHEQVKEVVEQVLEEERVKQQPIPEPEKDCDPNLRQDIPGSCLYEHHVGNND